MILALVLIGAGLMLIGQALAFGVIRAGAATLSRRWDCAVYGTTVVGLGLILLAIGRGA